MTRYFSYVGDLDDPAFHWDDPDQAPTTSNLPRRLCPREPHQSLGISTLHAMKLIEDGAYEGKQLDWAAWGLKMTGAQLRAFLEDCSGEPYAAELAALDPGKPYVLVAAEGG